jgi:hypothetical protein
MYFSRNGHVTFDTLPDPHTHARDLLNPFSHPAASANAPHSSATLAAQQAEQAAAPLASTALSIREDRKGGISGKGAREVPVRTLEDVRRLFAQGKTNGREREKKKKEKNTRMTFLSP